MPEEVFTRPYVAPKSDGSGKIRKRLRKAAKLFREAGYRIVRGPRGSRPDGNGVELDREVVELTRNAGQFRDQAAVLARLLALRRIAVTGDQR